MTIEGIYWRLAEDHTPVPCTVEEWHQLFTMRARNDQRRVALDKLPDGTLVSTVFLGIDHSMGEGPPILFETMVRDPRTRQWADQTRCATWDEALAMHAAALVRAIATPLWARGAQA
jgi:hypothetical protein